MLLFLLCVALSAEICVARVVNDLTLARVPVADRSDIEFARGTTNALETVLIKLTGNSGTPKTAQGRAVIAKAKRLVQQFGYEKPPRASGEVIGGNGGLLLRVEFDAQALSQEMLSQGLVLWGKERPETLIYITLADEAGKTTLTREMLGSDLPEAEIIRIVERQAANRGIPVSFPDAASAALLDSTQDVNLTEMAVGADGVALARFEKSPLGLWDSRWIFELAGDRQIFSNAGDIVVLLAEEATDSLADIIGKRFANPNVLGHQQSLTLKIVGIVDGRDYARVTQYLESLDTVRELFIEKVEGDEMRLTASIQGGYQGLGQSLSFGNVLTPNDEIPGEYRLLPQGI